MSLRKMGCGLDGRSPTDGTRANEQPTAAAIRSAPERFLENWINAALGFMFCVVLPIPLYATSQPFAGHWGGTESTIISSAVGFFIVWYCGGRFNAFPSATLHGNLAYVAPLAILTYALIAALLLLLRLDYSRVQFLGSGLLVLLWMSSVAHFRARSLTRIYVVIPRASIAEMPVVNSSRWLDFDEAQRRRLRVDAIVTDLNADFDKGQLALLAEAAISGVPVLDRRYVVELLTGRTPLSGLTPNEFGALLPSRQYLVLRRAVELGLTVLLLPAIVPVLLVVAFLVWMDSPGPIFFVQTRIGRRGEPFKMIKFRTMFHGAVGTGFTQAHDPRITPLGSFLRKYRLDELPQTFNILGGDMSWVGPRPEAESLERGYVRNIEHFALRGIVRPGVTGWAQINQDYGYAHERMRSKLEYDLYYLKHCSLWLDLVIILRTFVVVFTGKGAR